MIIYLEISRRNNNKKLDEKLKDLHDLQYQIEQLNRMVGDGQKEESKEARSECNESNSSSDVNNIHGSVRVLERKIN
jgi:ElaB/YqjD/DUF883 family membrane-anchored ribosome-binding protein